MKCREHPFYKARKAPKNDCPTCKAIWKWATQPFDHGVFGKTSKKDRRRLWALKQSSGNKG